MCGMQMKSPSEMSVQPFMVESPGPMPYSLYRVIVHIREGMLSGHCVSYCKTPSNRWTSPCLPWAPRIAINSEQSCWGRHGWRPLPFKTPAVELNKELVVARQPPTPLPSSPCRTVAAYGLQRVNRRERSL